MLFFVKLGISCLREWLRTFFVRKTGVGISARGVSDQGFDVVILGSIVIDGDRATVCIPGEATATVRNDEDVEWECLNINTRRGSEILTLTIITLSYSMMPSNNFAC